MAATEPEYDVIVETNLRTKMRDGVTLYSDLYRPAKDGRPADGKFSTILVRTFRNKELVFDIDARFFAGKGFILVFQDIRGRFKSEGNYYHGRNEAEDGYDTIEWIAKQPWSNGKVGMTGIFYLAAVQQAAASVNPPHLSSLFHVQAPLDYYNTHYRRGGETCLYTVPIVFMFAADSKEALANPALAKAFEADFTNARDWVKRWPVKRGMTSLSQTPFLEGWLLDPLDHPDYDDFWKEVPLWQPMEYLDEYSDIPGHYFSGWFDTYQEDQLYAALAPKKKKPLKLTMGPWLHNDFGRSAGDVDFGPDAIVNYRDYNVSPAQVVQTDAERRRDRCLGGTQSKDIRDGRWHGKKDPGWKARSRREVAVRERVAPDPGQTDRILSARRRRALTGEEHEACLFNDLYLRP